jgi:hypothetical protein
VCSGDSYTFPDGTTQTNITAQVIYTNNLQTVASLCDSIITTTVNVTTVDVAVSQSGSTLTANAVGALYQWLDCGNGLSSITGELSQVFTATINGSYAVEIEQSGCVDTSTCYNVTSIFISDEVFAKEINVFPNPTDGMLKIDLGNEYQKIEVTISDLQGRIVLESDFSSTQVVAIQFEESPGVYVMTIEADLREATIRLMRKYINEKGQINVPFLLMLRKYFFNTPKLSGRNT